jgi:hypothetical protein
MGYELDARVSITDRGKMFLFSASRPALSNGYRGTVSLGTKRPLREANHPPSYNAEIKMVNELCITQIM